MEDKLNLAECLICGNKNLVEDAEYCHICGNPLKNMCCYNKGYMGQIEQCLKASNKSIPNDARYCPYCGSKTLFLEKGVFGEENDAYTDGIDFEKIINSAPF
ncbi:MAG: hypothetical protein K2O52_00145 [Oscillospiraceae bacterium]|nr:hypothetical protein [Oscillospiraceae bacterium]